MDLENSTILSSKVDKSQIPPIHQKRILAFLNHFITSTCTFLNEFADKCESKFIEVERKMQKVESSLIILEAKLSSIPGLEKIDESVVPPLISKEDEVVKESQNRNQTEIEELECTVNESTAEVEVQDGVKASEDSRYKKFFKMVQFGVPPGAVKMKMSAEGLDCHILDNPDLILADGIRSELKEN